MMTLSERQALTETGQNLRAVDKGLLAMDESNPACNKRFAGLGFSQTEDAQRAWRELIVTPPELANSIGVAILCDETTHQQLQNGHIFVQALAGVVIVVVIKVDAGANTLTRHPSETVTQVSDVLHDRLAGYAGLGAQSVQVTTQVVCAVIKQLHQEGVLPEGLVFKPKMVLSGLDCAHQGTVDDLANVIVDCLLHVVPAEVPGIAFLSDGEVTHLASARLNAMNLSFRTGLPWALKSSFSRAIQQPALVIRVGEESNVQRAKRTTSLEAIS